MTDGSRLTQSIRQLLGAATGEDHDAILEAMRIDKLQADELMVNVFKCALADRAWGEPIAQTALSRRRLRERGQPSSGTSAASPEIRLSAPRRRRPSHGRRALGCRRAGFRLLLLGDRSAGGPGDGQRVGWGRGGG